MERSCAIYSSRRFFLCTGSVNEHCSKGWVLGVQASLVCCSWDVLISVCLERLTQPCSNRMHSPAYQWQSIWKVTLPVCRTMEPGRFNNKSTLKKRQNDACLGKSGHIHETENHHKSRIYNVLSSIMSSNFAFYWLFVWSFSVLGISIYQSIHCIYYWTQITLEYFHPVLINDIRSMYQKLQNYMWLWVFLHAQIVHHMFVKWQSRLIW